MVYVAIAFSLLIVGLGAVGLHSPARLLALVSVFQTRRGLLTAAGLRLLIGATFYLAADDSRAPELMRGLGLLVFVIGLITPFFGLARARRILVWWSAQGTTFVRLWCVMVVLFGLAIGWHFLPA